MTLVGLRAVDHVGLTVPDLDSAIAFFERVLGATVVYRDGPLIWPDQANSSRPTIAGTAMLRFGPVTNIELVAFADAPVGDAPALSAPGGHHLGLIVDDLDRSLLDLEHESGVRVLGQPRTIPADRPQAGTRYVFASTPWGLKLELLELPLSPPSGATSTGPRYRTAFDWRDRP